MSGPSRRAVLRAGVVAGVGLGVGIGVGIPFALDGGGTTSTGTLLRSRLPLPPAFARPLPVPPVLRPVAGAGGTDRYEITQTPATASILPGVRTPIWGYNGIFPGPTIVSRRGRATVVTHTNRLPVPSVVHLHGGRTPHDSDGYPLDLVNPTDMSYLDSHMDSGGTGAGGMDMGAMTPGDVSSGRRAYTYPLEQRAATLWYHDHRMGFTAPGVWRGLAGFHLVRDDEEDALGLPSGARELPLMITDRSFDADGSLRYPSVDPTLVNTPGVTARYYPGVLGDVMLVNGAPWPVATVDGATYRLRILNACNARRLDLRLDPQPDGALTQIGTDGGLLGAPVRHDHVELAPAQRLDVLVDFSSRPPGSVVTLVNDYGEGRMAEVMRFRVGEPTGDRFTVPDRLSTMDTLTARQAVRTRVFHFRTGSVDGTKSWLIDKEPFGPDTVAATCALSTVEVWRLMADFNHPVHVHLNHFQVLSRGSGGPGPFDAGWKDTIDLRPSEEAAIAIRFDGYPGKYVFHCHNLEHEDMAMMANFVTTR